MTQPDRRDDRRKRKAVRGGPLTHLIADAGWLIYGTLGLVLSILLAVLVAQPDPTESTAEAFFGWFVVLIPIGVVVGGGAGLVAQAGARRRLLGPATESRPAGKRQLARDAAAGLPVHDLRPSGRWARFYRSCARSVLRYHEVVDTVAAGPGRDWLVRIGETLDAELAEALRLARLGESLEPDELTRPGATVYHVLDRLRTAQHSFAETTERAAAIALDLRDHSDFVQVRAQLDMLAEQAPQLRGKGA